MLRCLATLVGYLNKPTGAVKRENSNIHSNKHSMLISRKFIDIISSKWMLACLLLCLVLPLAIGTGLVLKSMPLLKGHSLGSLIGSSDWSPSDGQFGFWPFIVGSVWVTIIALVFCIPLCLLASIYLTQFAPKWMLKFIRPVID